MKGYTLKEIAYKLEIDKNAYKELFHSIISDCKTFNFHDGLLLSVCKRAIDIIDTIGYAVRKYNLNTLYPLMRLQIDNCLILQAAILYKDNNNFFADLLNRDFQTRNYKIPATGEMMSERKLAKMLEIDFPTFLEKYEYCCDFVHFTNLSFSLPVRGVDFLSFQMNEEVGNKESKYRIQLFVDDLYEIDRILVLLINKCCSEFSPYKYQEV